MSRDIHGARDNGGRWGADPASSRVYVGAFVVASAATCLGGVAAIAAVTSGASTVTSLCLMAACVLVGALAAIAVVRLGARRSNVSTEPAPTSTAPAGGDRKQRRTARRDLRRTRRELRRTPVCSPAILLQEELSARYGVPVERVAPHVWRIDGELVEATLDPLTGQLMTGGRELQL